MSGTRRGRGQPGCGAPPGPRAARLARPAAGAAPALGLPGAKATGPARMTGAGRQPPRRPTPRPAAAAAVPERSAAAPAGPGARSKGTSGEQAEGLAVPVELEAVRGGLPAGRTALRRRWCRCRSCSRASASSPGSGGTVRARGQTAPPPPGSGLRGGRRRRQQFGGGGFPPQLVPVPCWESCSSTSFCFCNRSGHATGPFPPPPASAPPAPVSLLCVPAVPCTWHHCPLVPCPLFLHHPPCLSGHHELIKCFLLHSSFLHLPKLLLAWSGFGSFSSNFCKAKNTPFCFHHREDNFFYSPAV